MPSTSKHTHGVKHTSTTELKLDLPTKTLSTNSSSKSDSNPPLNNPKEIYPIGSYQHCDPKKLQANVSQLTVFIQNLQFPEPKHNKAGVLKVKCKEDLLTYSESISTPSRKERGYDFTSSTNSLFAESTFRVSKKFRSKCPSTSTEEQQKSTKSSYTLKSCDEQKSQDKVHTSQDMIDSNHEKSKKPVNTNGPEWLKPCRESFVAGAPRKFIGTCPMNYEQLSKMSKTRQKFFLTQDPRKVHCLVNPETLRSKAYTMKKEFNTLTQKVKHAQNICAVSSASESSENFICEVIDLENPLQLDFQGLDYTNTYQKDEQDLQNQHNYRRVCRYMERRLIKTETQANVEKELHNERLNVPKRFAIRDRDKPPVCMPPAEPIKLGKLFRSADKPYNKKIIDMEKERRKERYKNLYLRNKERKEQDIEKAEKRKTKEIETLPITLANKNFQKFQKTIDEAIDRSTKKEQLLKKTEVQRRAFPHTIRETKLFKRSLKQKNRVARDEAIVKKEFFQKRFHKEKQMPEAELEISSDSPYRSSEASKITEQSSDDEDNMEVGRKGSKFKLRGFQFKLGSNLRGKFHQHEKLRGTHKEKLCITRDQWLKELAPKKEKVKLDVEMGIQKLRSPDDPQFVLFPPPFGFKPPKAKFSAIREFRFKPLGGHYDRRLRKNLKFAKPRLRYTVKKFNLISYCFGNAAKRFCQLKDPFKEVSTLKLATTSEYMEAKAQKEKQRQQTLKQNRLNLLGIPCKPIKKSRLQTKCENSSSESDSEWVPERETFDQGQESCVTLKKSKIPLSKCCNMPAPKYRETTLRQHPRRPRNYDQQRIPSDIFDQVVLTTAEPHMYKLPKDMVNFANVDLKKTPYTDLFDARHHHDHWNPTQHKLVDVHYKANVVKPEITKVKRKLDRVIMENFHVAYPPCNQFVEMNLTMPEWDIDDIIKEHKKAPKLQTVDLRILKNKDICNQKDYVLRTRDPKEFEEYPGRQEYLKLLNDIKKSIKESKLGEETGKNLYVNETLLLGKLEDDLKSIESCLTSLSSSQCTNLTNDSGSFLLMEGTDKIPLDFIRKSIVPFEELQRSRFQAIPIDADKEEANPFKVLPFSGQKKTQMELTTPKDSFFTFNTRLKNGLRLRLEVPVEDIRKKFIGHGYNKHKAMVTTDIDENYVNELKNRSPTKLVKFKSRESFIKDALRLKFESMLIQGQMVRSKIYDRLNEQHWSDMQRVKILFEKLLAKWEKHEYDATMAIVYKVKNFYEETDRLKSEFRDLERKQVMLNMDIVFIEGHWIRCIMLQNFHYLLADQEWRMEHDWIHRLPKEVDKEIELESFDDSIAKRSTVNIREREKDDAWAIKFFYEDVYLQNKHPNLIVFPNAESFLKGLDNLKSKTFVLLLEMHFTLAIHTELQSKLETFVEWCAQDLKEREEYVNRKCAKLYFMKDRANWLQKRTIHFLEAPIEEAFNDELFHRDRAVITEAWRRIVPSNMRGSSEHALYPVDMVGMISDVVIDLIAKLESIPMEISNLYESKVRSRWAFLRKQSRQAYQIERRIEMEMVKVVKNLEPPYQKPKPSGKLPRYYIKKRKKSVQVEEKKITERAKFFFRAFNEEDIGVQTQDIRDSIAQVDIVEEEIVPFYFDHFLKLNGYTPNYNFKTQVEMRDGPEMERITIKSVVPEIQQRIEQWEIMKKKIMEENIAKNPKMYVDVMS